ncbi:hypothetical protein D3C78_1482690 [compost metagenome]
MRHLSKEEGIAVFVSSHLLAEMELMCDRVAIIQGGKLIDVRILGATDESLEANRVLIEVDRQQGAIDALHVQGISASAEGELAIAIESDREGTARINAVLVSAGIKVYSIRTQVKSLEDQFLEVTGGDRIG